VFVAEENLVSEERIVEVTVSVTVLLSIFACTLLTTYPCSSLTQSSKVSWSQVVFMPILSFTS